MKGGNGGRVDDAVGNKVLTVLLPSSRPHQDVRIKGLGRRVVVGTMARANCLGVLDHLVVDVLVGDDVRPPRWVVDVLRTLLNFDPIASRPLASNTNLMQ
jgi:hypothetical protein